MSDESSLAAVAVEGAVSAFSLLSGQFLATLVAGLSSIALARLLGPEGYGRYSLSTTVAALLTLATDFGLSAALTKEVSRLRAEGGEGEAARLVGLALRFNLLASALALAVGLALAPQLTLLTLNRPELVQLSRLAMPLVAATSVFSLTYAALLGAGDARALPLLLLVRDASRGVLSPLLALSGGCEGAVAGFVLGYVIAAAAGVALLRRRFGGLPSAPWGELRRMLGYGLPLYASTVLSAALGVYQNAVLAWFATDEEVGNLRVAGNFFALLQLLSAPISQALFPAFSRLDKGEAGVAFRYAVKYTALLLAPAGAFAAVASRDLVRLVYGGAYRLAPAYLSVQAAVLLLSGAGWGVTGSFLQGVGDTGALLKAAQVYAAAFVPLSLLLAPRAGALGVLVAGLASSLASTLYGLRAALRHGASLELRAALTIPLAVLLAAAPAYLASLAAWPHYAVRLAASAAAYLGAYTLLAPLLGCLDWGDLERLRGILERTPLRSPARLLIGLEGAAIRVVRGPRRGGPAHLYRPRPAASP